MPTQLRETGLGILGDMPWGTHCCHFFETRGDLVETSMPYFKAGLEAREFCFWLVHAPLTEPAARKAVQSLRGGDRYLADGSIEITSCREWHLKGGAFSLKRIMRRWDDKLDRALARGYTGMRISGNPNWLRQGDWKRFQEYESVLNESFAQKPIIALCSYALASCAAIEVLDVARSHQFALAKREGSWEVVEWRAPPTPDVYGALTMREREVLLLAAEGLSNPQIAEHLSIGVRTVESHRANLMGKLGVRNQTGLVRYALQRGLLPLDARRH